MALRTLGTTAQTTLNALAWNPQSAAADIAAIMTNIKQDNAVGKIIPGGFDQGGQVFFPNRFGYLFLKPGDYVAYDPTGWPIIVSAYAIANGSGWVHT